MKCEWCLTLNKVEKFHCIVCETPLGVPALVGKRGRELESALALAVTGGGARLVANSLIAREIDWTNSRVAKKCLQIALAEEFASFDYLCNIDENGVLYLGWKWPKAKFVNAVSVRLLRNGKLIGHHLEKRDDKSGMAAVNLSTEKGSVVDGVELAVSLRCHLDATKVMMSARKIQCLRESKDL